MHYIKEEIKNNTNINKAKRRAKRIKRGPSGSYSLYNVTPNAIVNTLNIKQGLLNVIFSR